MLAANRNLYLRHQTADADRIDAPHQLIAPADAANNELTFFLRAASCSKEQLVHFALRDAMMSAGRLEAANLLLVNPLLDGRKADPQLKSRITEIEQALGDLVRFVEPRHRNEIVQPTNATVNTLNSPALQSRKPPSNEYKRILLDRKNVCHVHFLIPAPNLSLSTEASSEL